MRSAPELIDDGVESSPAMDDSWTVEVEPSAYKFPILARFGIFMGVITLVFISMVALLPFVLPASVTISKAEKLISTVVGMDVQIKGDHSFRILPSLRLQAENVVQSNKDGAVAMHLPYLEIEMSSFGALSGSFDLNRVLLQGPSVRVSHARPVEDMPEQVTEIDRAWGWWRDMSIKELRIENGAFSLVDGSTGQVRKLEQFNLKNSSPAGSEPEDGLVFEGQGKLNDQAITLNVQTSDPQLLVSGNRWPFTVSIISALLNGTFKGSMAIRERVVGDGELVLAGSDAAAINDWIGPFLPTRKESALALNASLDLAGDELDIRRLNLSFGETDIEGQLTITGFNSAAPEISGLLTAETIDFGVAPAEQAVAMAAVPLIVPGMPFGKVEISWMKALWRDYAFGLGKAVIERQPATQRIQLTLDDTEIYGGTMRGMFALDVSEGMHALSIEGRAVGAQIGLLLGAGKPQARPPLSGKSTIEVNLFSVGSTPEQLVQALTGDVELIASEGVLGLSKLISELVPEAGEKLPFKTLNGTFKIAQGIAMSDDLLLLDGTLSLVAKGRVDLANGTIDLHVGRLGPDGDDRALKKFHVSGPAMDMRVEPVNGS
ncbi:MAG: AsmA-like C-terminal region-containing protein [Rhodospirillales bacterium]